MVTRVLVAGISASWLSATEAFGAVFRFGRMCEVHGFG